MLVTSCNIVRTRYLRNCQKLVRYVRVVPLSCEASSIKGCCKLRKKRIGASHYLGVIELLQKHSSENIWRRRWWQHALESWRSFHQKLRFLAFRYLKNLCSLPKGMQFLTSPKPWTWWMLLFESYYQKGWATYLLFAPFLLLTAMPSILFLNWCRTSPPLTDLI